ncbi:MAG: polysaccharide pyruvyl transferase CsaB [Stanieria sp.]
MSKIKAVICGYYGKDNGGDEALLMSLLQMLPKQVKPIVLSGNPKQTQQRYGVTSCDRTSAFAILKALKQSDWFIWGGGSLMQDLTSITSPIYYAGLMALAQQQGLKTIAWAQGIGPLKRSFTRWLTKQTLLGCQAISVRDYASAKLLADWELSPLIAPDPVWALEASPVKGLWDLPAPRVAVTLRPHPQLTLARLEILTKALIDFQKSTQTCILLVPFQPSQDTAIATKIASQLPGEHQIITLENPQQLKGLFKGVEMVIGMRLHSLIMAAAEECRCFALSYDPKVSQLISELDLPGWELTQLPENANQISTAWIDYYANGNALDSAQIRSLIDRALMHQELLNQMLR